MADLGFFGIKIYHLATLVTRLKIRLLGIAYFGQFYEKIHNQPKLSSNFFSTVKVMQ
jgi:hypothetical protein